MTNANPEVVASDRLWLAGFDIGSTTSRSTLAHARVRRQGVTGRMELADLNIACAPEGVFTPFDGERVDVEALAKQFDEWIEQFPVEPSEVAGGGALVTGLAARA